VCSERVAAENLGLAGLVAEELLKQGYQICVIDPEGDYRSLGTGPHTLLLGGTPSPLPAVTDIISFLENGAVSIVSRPLDAKQLPTTTATSSSYCAPCSLCVNVAAARIGSYWTKPNIT